MQSLRAPRNGRAAAAARLSRATVNRKLRAAFRRGGLHQAPGPFDHPENLVVREAAHRRERVNARGIQRFRFENISDPGDRRLVEQRVRDFCLWHRLDAPRRLLGIEISGQNVGSKITNRRTSLEIPYGGQLGHGHVECHRFASGSANNDPHLCARPTPPFSRDVQVPRTMHPHMGAKHQVP